MNKAHFERMGRAMAWADQETCAALCAHPAAASEALPLLAHLLAAEHVWLSRIEGREPRLAVWPALALDDCEPLARENAAALARALGSRSDADLAAIVRYRNSKGEQFANSLADILTQVLLHGAYHRGQIAREIRRCGGQPVSTDFITFVRDGEPTGG